MVTKQQIAAALDVVKAVADAIKEAKRIPAGHLYAVMMSHGMSLSSFEQIVGILVRGGLVERTASHELVWLLCAKCNGTGEIRHGRTLVRCPACK